MIRTNQKTKNIPELRFPGFEDEWEEKILGEVVDNYGGKSLEKYCDPKGEYKFISIGNYTKEGRYNDDGRRVVLNEETRKKLLDENDLVMVLNDKTTTGEIIGSTILIDKDDTYIYNQRSEKLVPKDSFNPEYLWHFFNSKEFRKKIFRISQGGTQIYVNFSSVKKLKLEIPILSEQQKIASFLGAVDECIDNLKKQKEKLEEYKKGVMQKIFSQEIRFKDDNGKDFPDWEEKQLGDVFKSTRGQGFSKEKVSEKGSNECILYGELYTTYDEVISEIKSKTNSSEGTPSKVGDLLVPTSTTTSGIDLANFTALNKEGVRLGGDITILRAKKKLSNIFFAYYLSNYKKTEVAKYAQGVTIIHLYFKHFKNTQIEMPAIKEQQKIAEFLTSVDELIELKEKQISAVEHWKKGLMQKMFV